jgi:O-succinylbenzoic acid--CoA ligase
MRPLPLWLRRANPRAGALLLPDRTLTYGELASLPGKPGLNALAADAPSLALAFARSGLSGGTAFPLSPALAPAARERLIALAEAERDARLALVIATSGSEGAPKGVKLPWRAVAAAARMGAAAVALRPGDVWLACLPLYHVGGAMVLYRCWRAGAAATVPAGFDADAAARALHDFGITHVSLVPALLARLLEAGVAPPPTLRCALVGGAALSATLHAKARTAGWPIRPTYGMTETGAQATLWSGGEAWREGAVGAPLPGVRIEAAQADDAGVGRLRIRTPARMRGYLGAAPAGAWIETQDLGRVDADGTVHIVGRADDMLVSGGVNVHPLEVEARLVECPGVGEAGVAGVADAVWGDIVAAVYEGNAAPADVEAWCRERLPGPQRPRRFVRVASLPRTGSGKLDRRGLAALLGRPA